MIPFILGGEIIMQFGAVTWWIVATVWTIVVGVIAYFLKRTISKQDKHEEDINHIKLTYVTRDQLKEFKEETNSVLDKLQKDVASIKDNTLTKADFYRLQAATDKKLDKLYDLMIGIRGDKNG